MILKFDKLKDIKEFALVLSAELEKLGFSDLAKEVKFFEHNTYTTSSEYLGEFRILAKKIKVNKLPLNKSTIASLDIVIKKIDVAFNQ